MGGRGMGDLSGRIVREEDFDFFEGWRIIIKYF